MFNRSWLFMWRSDRGPDRNTIKDCRPETGQRNPHGRSYTSDMMLAHFDHHRAAVFAVKEVDE